MNESVGVGLVTYNRPDRLAQSLPSLMENLIPGTEVYLYDDGSNIEHLDEYAAIIQPYASQLQWMSATENRGVCFAKNKLLKAMMDDRKRYLFIMEDDQVLLSPKAISLYIDAHKSYKRCHHMMFAHHGGLNRGVNHPHLNVRVEAWPNCVGSWCFYTKDAINEVGYMDENFIWNAMEHVEHTHRIQKAGMLGIPPDRWGWFPDAIGSRNYIQEVEGGSGGLSSDMLSALLYWKKKDPAHFPLDYLIQRIQSSLAVESTMAEG